MLEMHAHRVKRVYRRCRLLVAGSAMWLASCQMPGSDPRAGDNIDVPPERAGRNIPEAAEAEQRREQESPPVAEDTRGRGYEPAPYAGTALPQPGTSNVTPDTEVTYGRQDAGRKGAGAGSHE